MGRSQMPTRGLALGLRYRLRRVAACMRQQDVARRTGISTTRYSAIERGEQTPTELEQTLIEGALPELELLADGGANRES